jgi:lysophospholipase
VLFKVDRGCLVVNITQCMKGHVEASYANGKVLLDAGVIPGADMTTEAVFIFLIFKLILIGRITY